MVEKCNPTPELAFYSNIFPTRKRDGTTRVILNSKEFNKCVTHTHFKISSIKDVISLIHPNCFFMTIDIKDAYFFVYIQPKDRKWLRFMWKNQYFQITCLLQGLTSAPRIFTKLLKPILSHFRKLGIMVVCYIDDCFFIAPSAETLRKHVKYAMQMFDSVGITVNVRKSVLTPTQEVEFLGITLNSVNMSATLPSRRKESIKSQGLRLLKKDPTLHDLAVFIGLAVASDSAVNLARLSYKYLEIVRNQELSQNRGNYNTVITLDDHAKDKIKWWVSNVDYQTKFLASCPTHLEIHTDACLTNWGAKVKDTKTGGHWAHEELDHINCLESKAILLGLNSLCKHCTQTHIQLRSDNTTAIACIDRCGSAKFNLNVITEQIFDWAWLRGITLSAEYVKGIDNTVADVESRVKNLDTEWMVPFVFSKDCVKISILQILTSLHHDLMLSYLHTYPGNQTYMHYLRTLSQLTGLI